MTPSLPKTVKVGWQVFTIEDWPESDARDEGRAGDIRYEKGVIRISDGLTPQKRAETLLHEIIHAVNDQNDIDPEELAKKDYPEEAMTRSMASALSSVFANNADLLTYFLSVWHRDSAHPRFEVVDKIRDLDEAVEARANFSVADALKKKTVF